MPNLAYVQRTTSNAGVTGDVISKSFDGGRVMHGGNISLTRLTRLSLGLTRQKGGGPTVKNISEVDPIYSGNTFGRTPTHVVAKSTTTIGGNGNVFLQKMGDHVTHSPHVQTRSRYTFLQQRAWNQSTAETLTYTNTYTNTNVQHHSIADGAGVATADHATRSPRTNNPEITFMDGSRYPVNKTLPLKLNG